MIRRTMCIAAAMLLALTATVAGQEGETETKKSLPFEFKISGDSVESFKAEFVLNAKLDQSTPEGVVNGYSLLADHRTEVSSEMEKKIFKDVERILAGAVEPLEAKLLSEGMLKKVKEARKESDEESSSDYNAEATEITGVTDGEEGAKLVETVQKTTYSVDGWDPETGEPTGKKETQTQENKQRYTCVKGEDGKWRIERTERWGVDYDDWDGMSEPAEKWIETRTMIHWVMEQAKPEKPEELKQDTPENTAMSLFNCLFRSRDAWEHELQMRVIRGWADAAMALFTEKGLKGPTKEEEGLEDVTEEAKREIDFVSDDPDGVKRVKFKPRSEWFGSVEIYVKKEGDVWKIVKAGYYETDWDMDSGEMKETEFVEEYNLRMLAWR